MPRVSAGKLLDLASKVLEAVGTPPEPARLVAKQLVEANLTGHDSHGVVRLPQYCKDRKDGQIKPDAQPTIERENATTAVVDGQRGWGPVAAWFATDLAIRKAEQAGISAVCVRNTYHVGRVGVYPEAAAVKGYVGIAFCNVHGGGRVAPWGGKEGLLGTNPIAIAVPTENSPIVVDFASSAVAEGKVRLAMFEGRKVPLGWVLDEEGEFSDDPNEAYGPGTLAPLGGDQGHKGYGLAVALDLLGGVLSGAGCGLMTKWYGNGLLLQVIDPANFGDPAEFRRGIQDYCRYLKSASPRDGVEEVWLPGEVEKNHRAVRAEQGVEVATEVWQQLGQLNDELGITSSR